MGCLSTGQLRAGGIVRHLLSFFLRDDSAQQLCCSSGPAKLAINTSGGSQYIHIIGSELQRLLQPLGGVGVLCPLGSQTGSANLQVGILRMTLCQRFE